MAVDLCLTPPIETGPRPIDRLHPFQAMAKSPVQNMPQADSRRAFWLEVRSAISILESALNRRAQETKALELGLLGKCAGAIKGVLSAYLVLE